MKSRIALIVAAAAALLCASSVARAQSGCPPEQQPCMVLVPESGPAPDPAPAPTASAQIIVSTPAPAPAPIVVASPGAGMAPPPMQEEQVTTRPIWGMVIPGAILLGAGWVINVFVGSIVGLIGGGIGGSDAAIDYFGFSLIPIIGPFAQIGYFDFDADSGLLGYHIVLGLIQTLGFSLALIGTILQQEVREPLYVELDDQGTSLSFMPYASPQAAGLGATLSF